MPQCKRLVSVSFAASIILSASGSSQNTTPASIGDDVVCGRCRIRATPILSIGDAEGPGALVSAPTAVRVDGRGRYWVVGGVGQLGVPTVYSPRGQFLRAAGRSGYGPSEFQSVIDVVPLPGDSLLVLDEAQRATVLTPELEAARHIRIPTPIANAAVLRWPASVMGYSMHAGGLRGGPTLHEFSFSGPDVIVRKSFGPEWSPTDRSSRRGVPQSLSTGAMGVWAAWEQSYRLDLWNAPGSHALRVERVSEWFAADGSGFMGTRETPPAPTLTAAVEDSAGRIWTFSSVAAPEWREAWPPQAAGEVRLADFAMEKLHRTTVEVLDLKARKVIARATLNAWVCAVLPGLRVAFYTVDSDGIPRIEISQLSLHGL